MADDGEKRPGRLPSAGEDLAAARALSPAQRLAYADTDFLLRDELRPVRLQLELLKAELLFQDNAISSTVVVFGSARVPEPAEAAARLQEALRLSAASPQDEKLAQAASIAERVAEKSRYYEEARRFAHIVSRAAEKTPEKDCVIVTGGGPGIMEAANRGAHEAGASSIGLNIVLPAEQQPNRYLDPDLSLQFHYFALRKMHFLMRARALVVFPGGFGTLDELFDALTLLQTRKARPMPVLIFGRDYWMKVIDFEAMVEEGTIAEEDLALFRYVDTAEEAWAIIRDSVGETAFDPSD
jgi:uncharacterized protein (TIGR00730 family)